jgi:hypothetical protein
MIRPSIACLSIALAALAASCSRRPPDEVTTIRTPRADIHLTYEYWKLGPLVSDSARLVAHLVKDGAEDNQIIVDGNYVTIRKITWPRPDHMIVCVTYLDEVNEWKRDVTLTVGGVSKLLLVELRAAEKSSINRIGFDPPPQNSCPVTAVAA